MLNYLSDTRKQLLNPSSNLEQKLMVYMLKGGGAGEGSYKPSTQPTERDRLKSLVKNKTSIGGEIKEVSRFEVDWNKNLATVINNEHYVFLIVYEPTKGGISELLKVFPINSTENKWGTSSRNKHNNLTNAQGEANWLRGKLQTSSNPILEIYPNPNSYCSFGEIVKEPYVKRVDLPYETKNITIVTVPTAGGRPLEVTTCIYPNNPDNYLKPLDIVWIKRLHWSGTEFHHVGIYLGNNQVCEIAGNTSDKKGARINNWSDFIEDGQGELFAYRCIIPY